MRGEVPHFGFVTLRGCGRSLFICLGRSLVRLVRAVGLVRFVLGAVLAVCVLLLFWAFLVSVWSFSVSAAFRAFAAVVLLLKRGVTLAVQRREVIRD